MSLVLYRKYRPQTFAEVIGQEHVVKTLTNAISQGTISQAYLFAGPRGSGKTTIARLFAKSINCQNRKEGEFEPCNHCASCLEIMEGRSMDIVEIDAASHRGIDEIRELKEGARISPTKSKYKVFIIDEAHQLTKEAANALLKILEEPPSHVIFILATTEIHKMIPTIISRCQRFDFRKLTLKEIVKRLETIVKKEGKEVERSALELIASIAAGSLRDAESLLDQALIFAGKKGKVTTQTIQELFGLVDKKIIVEFSDLLFQKKLFEAIKYLDQLNEKGIDLQEFVTNLLSYLRQGLILKITGKEEELIFSNFTSEDLEKLKNQVANFSQSELQRMINLLLEAQNKMKYSSITQLPLELAIIEICQKI